MKRYIAVVKPRNAPVQSFDFNATSDQGAGSRARITALKLYQNPENFVMVGMRKVPADASDETVEETVADICAVFNAQ